MAKEKKLKVNLAQDQFCRAYVSEEFFGHGANAYMSVYKVTYDVAKRNASRLLTNADICARINELLEEGGLNDNFVDKQLLYLITQHEDKPAKVAAIKEYNKLKRRVTQKLEVKVEGNPIQIYIPDNKR